MKRFPLLLLVMGVLFLAVGMGGKPADVLSETRVKKISIADREVLAQSKPLVVSFSSPMVGPDAIDKPVAEKEMPFRLDPPVAGSGRWISDSSFVFEPKDGYPRAQTFYMVLSPGLKALDGTPAHYYFSFSTEANNVKQVWIEEYSPRRKQAVVMVDFALPVTSDDARAQISLSRNGTADSVPYTLEQRDEMSARQTITIPDVEKGQRLDLVIRAAGASSAGLGLVRDYSATLSFESSEGAAGPAVVEDKASKKISDVDFRYVSSYAEERGTMSAYFSLSTGIASHNQKEFIRVTPDLPYTLTYSGIRITEGLEPRTRVTVTLLPGLMDQDGAVLDREISRSTVTKDRDGTVFFSDAGNYLTPALGGRVGVTLTNLDKVQVNLYRQYDNNLPFTTLGSDYYSESGANGMMREVYSTSFPVSFKTNEMVSRAIDVAALAKGRKGVYTLEVVGYASQGSRDSSIYQYPSAREKRVVVLTDLGVVARAFPSGATVFVAGLSTGKPVAGATVALYSASNQLLVEGATDAQGLFLHTRDTAWDKQLTPAVAVVRKDDDISILRMEDNVAVELPESASRAYLDSGYEAFLFTPRGVFRPGETVDVKAFVRDKNHAAPQPFPVVMAVKSSRGAEVYRSTVTLSAEGGAEMFFSLPGSAPMGDYSARIFIPGQEDTPLGRVNFTVENFMPPRLEITLTPKAEWLVGRDALPVRIQADYLFGAPGANLPYTLGYIAAGAPFTPKGWEGYRFGNLEKPFATESDLSHVRGNLDEKGAATVDFQAPASWDASGMLQLRLVASVQEDGGRWDNQFATVSYFPTPFLLGIKTGPDAARGKENAARSQEVNKPVDVRVAAVKPDGGTTDPGMLFAEVHHMQRVWNTLYRNGRYVYDFTERPVPFMTQKLTVKDGQASFSFTPQAAGEYRIRCATRDGGVVAVRRVSVWDAGGRMSSDGLGRMDKVELTLDKPAYRAGDTARLSLKAPFTGTLYLGVERSGQLSTRVLPLSSPAAVLDIPVTAAMDPNATITAWVVRPMEKDAKSWFPHRAYGAVPLVLDVKPHALHVEAAPPARVEPGKTLGIPFTVKDEKGLPVQGEFAVAFVDEGVLSLSNFATPDPLAFFMEPRRMAGQSYDMYNLLLRPESKVTRLLQAGGDGLLNYMGGLSTQPIYLMEFQATVLTDAEGKGLAEFAIPEYSGKGRLMIVGASGNRFARAEARVPVGRDLVVEATAPAVVAPTDTFSIHVKAFSLVDTLQGKVEIKASVDGPLALTGETTRGFTLQGKGTETFLLEAKALKGHDVATVTLHVRVEGHPELTFAKTLETVVRSPYPRTSVVHSALIDGGSTAPLVPGGTWLPGSTSASLTVGGSPAFAVLPSIEFLREYPFGCLEQVVSRAWPYLTFSSVVAALNPEEAEYTAKELADIVAMIGAMQTDDGGFGYWPHWGAASPWASVNATFLLLEAKARVAVPKAMMDGALRYMRALLFMDDRYFGSSMFANTTKAYAAFVLTRAGEAPLSWLQVLSERQKEMLPSGRIFLAAAKSLHAGNPSALQALDKEALEIPAAKIVYNDSLESTLRNRSLLLLAWSLVAPTDPKTRELCIAVADELGALKYPTTQEAGAAALALGTYLEKAGVERGDVAAKVLRGGKVIATSTPGVPLVVSNAELPLDTGGAPTPVSVSAEGKGQAFAVYSVRGLPVEAPAPVEAGLSIDRLWRDASGKALDLGSGKVTLKKGDTVTVELTIKPQRLIEHLVLVDMLPGGLAVEDSQVKLAALKSTSDNGGGNNGNGNDDGEDGEARKTVRSPRNFVEAREDRVIAFMDPVSEPLIYKYTLRAVSAGTFVLPPVAAEGMYAPQTRAVTGSGSVVIK